MGSPVTMSAPVSYSTTPLAGSGKDQSSTSVEQKPNTSILTKEQRAALDLPVCGYLPGPYSPMQPTLPFYSIDPKGHLTGPDLTDPRYEGLYMVKELKKIDLQYKDTLPGWVGLAITGTMVAGIAMATSDKANGTAKSVGTWMSLPGVILTIEFGPAIHLLGFTLIPALINNSRIPMKKDQANILIAVNNQKVNEYNGQVAVLSDEQAKIDNARAAAIAADRAAKAATFLQLDQTVDMLRCLVGRGDNCNFNTPIISGPLRARVEALLTSLYQLKNAANDLSMTPKTFKKSLIPSMSMANILKNDCFAFNKKIVKRHSQALKLINDFVHLSCSGFFDQRLLSEAVNKSTETGDLSIFDRQYIRDLRTYQILSVKCPEMDRMVSRYDKYGCGASGAVYTNLSGILANCIRNNDLTDFDAAIKKADAKLSNIIAKANRRLEQVNDLESYLITKKGKSSPAGWLNRYNAIYNEIQDLKNDAYCNDVSAGIRKINGEIALNVAIGTLRKYIKDYERKNSNPPALEVKAFGFTNFFLALGSAKNTPQGVCVNIEFSYIRNQDEKNAYSYVRTLCYDESSETWHEAGQAEYLRRTIGRSVYNFFAGYVKAALFLDFLKWLTL